MRHYIKILAFFFISLGIVSCDDDEPVVPNPTKTYTATLNGANESTPNTSTATGTATLTYNTNTKIFTVMVMHNVPNPTAGHIHKGAVGVAGGVIFGFPSATSPISYTSVALDAAQESDLYAGLYYVNIHTAAYPGGEIRGQLIKQ